MNRRSSHVIRVVVLLVIVGAAAAWFFIDRARASAETGLEASGTIEVEEVRISPEMGGRVASISAEIGDAVSAGDALIVFDTTLLEGNLAQAEAQLAAAQANYDLLAAGASDEQIAAADAGVARAQATLDAIETQIEQVEAQLDEVSAEIDDLSPELAQSPTAALQLEWAQRLQASLQQQQQSLEAQRISAEVGVDAAEAQRDTVTAGARDEQLEAAEAQISAATAAISLLQTQIERQTLTAPLDGMVLTQAAEVGEFAAPGATLLVVGNLEDLTITVYVPEDRYGQIGLGDRAEIRVDSYPDDVFHGTVQRIADQAQFTPRNVQTAEGRASTVYAIELAVDDADQQLKPGMPADVIFGSG